MLHADLPEPLGRLLTTLTSLLDKRHAELLRPLFLGLLLAGGRRTATTWFRAGGLAEEFRRGYTLLGTLGKGKARSCAAVLFSRLRRDLDPGDHWLFALDDTPTARYGPHVQGAGVHHNPAPGPAGSPDVYGRVFVVLGLLATHPA